MFWPSGFWSETPGACKSSPESSQEEKKPNKLQISHSLLRHQRNEAAAQTTSVRSGDAGRWAEAASTGLEKPQLRPVSGPSRGADPSSTDRWELGAPGLRECCHQECHRALRMKSQEPARPAAGGESHRCETAGSPVLINGGLSRCPLATCLSSLEKWLFRSSVQFLIRWFFCS